MLPSLLLASTTAQHSIYTIARQGPGSYSTPAYASRVFVAEEWAFIQKPFLLGSGAPAR